jgi:hypothetical protein
MRRVKKGFRTNKLIVALKYCGTILILTLKISRTHVTQFVVHAVFYAKLIFIAVNRV